MSSSDGPSPGSDLVEPTATLTLFGFEPTEARVVVQPRTRRWRIARVVRVGAGAVLLAPLAALVPPHAPWAIGALAGGVILGLRRWRERYTLVELEGRCPSCGAEIHHEGGARLEQPHTVSCESCHHQSTLRVGGLREPEGS